VTTIVVVPGREVALFIILVAFWSVVVTVTVGTIVVPIDNSLLYTKTTGLKLLMVIPSILRSFRLASLLGGPWFVNIKGLIAEFTIILDVKSTFWLMSKVSWVFVS